MQPLTRGNYSARLAGSAADVAAALKLRQLSFRGGRGLAGSDADRYDAACAHMLVEQSGRIVACCRLASFATGSTIGDSYAAQFYDLTALSGFAEPMMELGRFCLHPGESHPDILRVAWAALTQMVDQGGVAMLFGCSSFDGADPAPHRAALAYLASHHLGPAAMQPRILAAESIALRPLADAASMAMPALPSLLRTYLGMGGWVSDHAVIDRELNTLHVFTGLEVAQVPAARARALRGLAGHATS